MKRILSVIVYILLTVAVVAQQDTTAFMRQLINLDGISDVTPLQSRIFKEKYVMKIQQNVDGDNADKGTFNQRIFVALKGTDRPTVLVTEGYFADYGYRDFQEELCKLFDANMIVVEYRYFAESTPEPCNWDYLTVDNSLRDLHNVRTTLGKILPGKWISTGTSKGGQTTMFYRATYPNDVDVSVSYVAPLNSSLEDGRHEVFLAKKVGTKAERATILKAQQEMLKRRDKMVPLFKQYCEERNYHFYLPIEEIYDYCIFEYSFAHWQYGTPIEQIPPVTASDEELFNHFMTVAGPDYFVYPNRFLSFDVQAAKELGYYGYSLKGLKKWTVVKDTKNYLKKIMLPPELRNLQFDPTLYNRTVKFLKEEDPTQIFIYGETDPWSASGVCTWLDCSKKKNMRIYVQPRGSHSSRIETMPEDLRDDIINRITEWLK